MYTASPSPSCSPTGCFAVGVLLAATSAAQDPVPGFSPEPRTIGSPANRVLCVHAADLDGDGDLDVVGAGERDDTVAWYENLGHGAFSDRRVITTDVDHPIALDTADFDLDGDLDIVSASRDDNKIAWYENLGGHFSTQRVLTTSAYRTESVQAADLDGDGQPDIVWGSREHQAPVAWHRNLGGRDFSEHRVLATGVAGRIGVRTGDLDNDGDLDLAWASLDADTVAWQENRGDGQFGEYRRIGGTAGHEVHIEDLDLDGDMDVVANAPANHEGRTHSVWYENLGDGEFAMRELGDDGPDRRSSYCSADLDGDGDRDVCSVAYDDDTTAWYENLGDGTFTHRIVSTAARGGLVSEARDLDGDGDVDLLVAAYYRGVLWFENLSHAAPPRIPFAAARTIADTSRGAAGLVVADIDDDGQSDVAWVGKSGRGAVAWARNDGRGFAAPRSLEQAEFSYDLHVADLDGDNALDILSGGLSWHKNLGAGTFSTRRTIAATGDPAKGIHAADLDGDGDPEPVYTFDDKVAYHDNMGDGTFADRTVIATGADGLHAVRSADVDSDGDVDIVVASRIDDTVAWHENTGDGFLEHVLSTTARDNQALAVGDLDGDGDTDVVWPRSPSGLILWQENLDGGAFSEPRRLAAGIPGTVRGLDVIDMDRDGDLDVVSVATHVQWHENHGAAFATHTVSEPQHGTSRVVAADVDRDGDVDIVYTSPSPPGVLWHENLTHSGPVAAPTIIATRALFGRVEVFWEPVPPEGAGSSPIVRYVVVAWSPNGAPTRQCTARAHVRRCVVQGLLTGATYELAVRAESAVGRGPPSVAVATTLPPSRRGLLAFSEAQILATDADGAASVHAADFDRDGDLDIVVGSSADDVIAWHENLGTGSFSARRVISTAADNVEEIHAADLDADGWPDVLSASFNDDEIAWYRNGGDGDFGAQQVITTEANGARFVHAADLDGDGDTDVLSASWLDDKIAWYENDGAGSFSAQRTITTDADAGRAVHAADLDLDGDLDVLSASAHDDKIAWYENQGGGEFSAQRVIADDARYAVSVFAADFDGDGDPDVVAGAQRGEEITWYRNEGRGVFSAPRIVAENIGAPVYVHAADIDGDGDTDVVGVSKGDNRVAWYENLGGVFGVEHVISTSQADPRSVHAADVDGDGDIDVLAASEGDDTVAWYENLGRVPTAPVLAPGNIRAVADLGSISVTWDPISTDGDGGAAILRYVVVAVPEIVADTVTCTSSASDPGCVLAGLTSGVAYSITVHAENELSPGPASSP